MKIRVKYKDGVEQAFRSRPGEWFDLRASSDYTFVKGDILTIDLGIAMELPEGYEALIRPRSSTAKKFGLMMACSGVIDNEYRGDNDWWGFGAYAIRSGTIHKNDRICQFRIVKQQDGIDSEISFDVVDMLGNEDRGGFGSTGVR